jgi:hypothetical protein
MTDADLMPDEERDRLLAEHGPNYVGWEYYARWLAAYRAARPDDHRDDLELIPVFAEWPEGVPIGSRLRLPGVVGDEGWWT